MTDSTKETIPMKEAIALSKRQAAEILGISVRTIERLIALKHLEVHRLGRRVLIRPVALESLLRRDHPTRAA
jgi:excisionase family DNA binding protein